MPPLRKKQHDFGHYDTAFCGGANAKSGKGAGPRNHGGDHQRHQKVFVYPAWNKNGCDVYFVAAGRAEKAPKLEVDTSAISKSSPLLAAMLLSMVVGADGVRDEGYDDSDATIFYLIGAILAIGAVLGALLVTVLGRSLAKRTKRPTTTTATTSTQTAGLTQSTSIYIHRSGDCYHRADCSCVRQFPARSVRPCRLCLPELGGVW